tara:strand:+ start:294 stop:530 length:237 start_codon:yes stop_codon:yes gene_type:complete
MKLTNEQLDKYISLYLNDIEDYGEGTEYLLAESVLSPIKTLLVESKNSETNILTETLKTASTYEKDIIKDFIVYIESI